MKIGVALGGGGAKGLAHLSMLEALDEMGVRPHMISGTSIGAIIGVLYAAGNPGSEIRAHIEELMSVPQSLSDAIGARRMLGWLEYIDLGIGRASVLKVDTLLEDLEAAVGVSCFEQLPIPLRIVAANFWERTEVVFDSGPIIPAVAASFALPGLFQPVVHEAAVLIDGGSVNPLPYDLLQDHCDIVIAVDVMGMRDPGEDMLPSYGEVIFNTFQIAEKSIIKEKLKARPPSIYIEPNIQGIKVLDFHKAESIFAQSRGAREQLKRELETILGTG